MGMEKAFWEELQEYNRRDIYPFHMPGHKRNPAAAGLCDPYLSDITEIEGFDDLHHASGILRDAQAAAAALFGAQESRFLVNGSTAGILSAISGCLLPGETLLLARNSHRSAYHGAQLRCLSVRYLYPRPEERYHLNGGIAPEDVGEALDKEPSARAVFVTSPTYDGLVSDIGGIAREAHKRGRILIVDEAHGAHLQFHPAFPRSALESGADVVIQSVHKTLPSLTQTALLHFGRDNRLDEAAKERIRRFLSVYQSSSPSYLLMASIDRCRQMLEREGGRLYEAYIPELMRFRTRMEGLRNIRLVGRELEGTAAIAGTDPSRLVFAAPQYVRSGPWMEEKLLAEHRIQMEMAAPGYVVGISSCMDTPEGFARLAQAMEQLDREMPFCLRKRALEKTGHSQEEILCRARNEAVLPIYEAADREGVSLPLRDAPGKISREYVYLYPPGIPLLVPGERVSGECAALLAQLLREGLDVRGLDPAPGDWMNRQTGPEEAWRLRVCI